MKRNQILVIIGVVCFFGFLLLFIMQQNRQKYILNLEIKNASVEIYKQEDTSDKLIIKDLSQNKKLRLKKGDYIIKYTGNNGYNSDLEKVTLDNEEKTVHIIPRLLDSKLSDMLSLETSSINTVLNSSLVGINNYSISAGKLLEEGQWYTTTLVYKGSDVYNADTQRIVLEKKEGKWKIAGGPNIIISKFENPTIPGVVVDYANNTLFAQLDRRFQSESEKNTSDIPYDD